MPRSPTYGPPTQLVLNGAERLRLQRQSENLADYRCILNRAGLIENAKQPLWHGIRRMAKASKYFSNELNSELQSCSPERRDHRRARRVQRDGMRIRSLHAHDAGLAHGRAATDPQVDNDERHAHGQQAGHAEEHAGRR